MSVAMGCIHRWQIDSHNAGTCSLCGEVRQFPWDGKGPVIVIKKGNHNSTAMQKEEHMSIIKKRHKYYEENKEAIIADLLTTGRPATRKKWNIAQSTLCSLEKRWLTKEQKAAIPTDGQPTQGATPTPTNTTPSNGRLPPFPQFSNTWEPSVQLEWLEVYRELATKEKSTVATTS